MEANLLFSLLDALGSSSADDARGTTTKRLFSRSTRWCRWCWRRRGTRRARRADADSERVDVENTDDAIDDARMTTAIGRRAVCRRSIRFEVGTFPFSLFGPEWGLVFESWFVVSRMGTGRRGGGGFVRI